MFFIVFILFCFFVVDKIRNPYFWKNLSYGPVITLQSESGKANFSEDRNKFDEFSKDIKSILFNPYVGVFSQVFIIAC